MDPLSIVAVAASVLQIAQMGGQLSVKLFTFSRKIKNADKSIASISQEIASTGAILQQLGLQLQDDEQLRLCSKEAVAGAESIVQECQSVFSELDKALDGRISDHKLIIGWKQKIQFTFLESHVNLLRANLERLKTSLLVILNVLVLAEQVRSREAVPMLREQKELIQNLVDDRNALEKQYRVYQYAIEQSDTSQYSSLATLAITSDSKPAERELTTTQPAINSSFQASRSIEADQDDVVELPRIIRIRKQEIEHHCLLVSNLLREISLVQYKISHEIRRRMEDVILRAHWQHWLSFQNRCGPDVFLRFFRGYDQILTFWVDEIESQNSTNADIMWAGSKMPASHDEPIFFDMQAEMLDSRTEVINRPDLHTGSHLTTAEDEEDRQAEYRVLVAKLEQDPKAARRDKEELAKDQERMKAQMKQSFRVNSVRKVQLPPELQKVKADLSEVKCAKMPKTEAAEAAAMIAAQEYPESRPQRVQLVSVPPNPPPPPLPPGKRDSLRSRFGSVFSRSPLGAIPSDNRQSAPSREPGLTTISTNDYTRPYDAVGYSYVPSYRSLPAELPADASSAQLESPISTEAACTAQSEHGDRSEVESDSDSDDDLFQIPLNSRAPQETGDTLNIPHEPVSFSQAGGKLGDESSTSSTEMTVGAIWQKIQMNQHRESRTRVSNAQETPEPIWPERYTNAYDPSLSGADDKNDDDDIVDSLLQQYTTLSPEELEILSRPMNEKDAAY